MTFQKKVLDIIHHLYGPMSLKAFVDILQESRTNTSLMSLSVLLQVPPEEQEFVGAYVAAFNATTTCLSDEACPEFTPEMLSAPMVTEELFRQIEQLASKPLAELQSTWEKEGRRSGAVQAALTILQSTPA